jgi:hypothetical protein
MTKVKRQHNTGVLTIRALTVIWFYGININDAANGIPLGHPRPHNITHTREFHAMVNER